MRFNVGDGVNLEHLVRDRDNEPAAATVALTVTSPSGVISTPTVTTDTVGTYSAATFVANEAGAWAYVWLVTGAVTDVQPGTFMVDAAEDRSYVSLSLLKSSLGITDTARDDLLDLARAAASEAVNRHTGRKFYRTAETTRTLTPRVARGSFGSVLLTPDIATLATLSTGSGASYAAWTAGTYEPVYFEDDDSATTIVGFRSVGSAWPTGSGRVRITAQWGWAAVPPAVEQATLILASRLFKRKDSPEGVAGSAEWGGIRLTRSDPDVARLLARYTLAAIG